MISIIIPTLNEQDYLPRLLKSIEDQDFQDLEIIIADNNSTDKTLEIAQSFGARVVEGGLPSIARNRGAEAAKGEYLLFLDADIVLPAGFLRKLYEKFEDDFIDICVPALRPFDSEKTIYTTIFALFNTYIKLMEGIKPQGGGACIFVTKRLHKRISGFDESRRRSEDLDYINRAAGVGRFNSYIDLFVCFSVRRFEAEGIAACAQKYLRSEFIFFFTGKQDKKKEYDYGNFTKAVTSAAEAKKGSVDNMSVKKLLVRFNRLMQKLRQQLKELGLDDKIIRIKRNDQ